MEGNVFAVDDREAWTAMRAQPLHEEQIRLLTDMHRVATAVHMAWLNHLLQLLLLDGAVVHDVVHRPIPSEMALEFEGLAQDRADDHAVLPPAASHLRLRAIAVGLLRQVAEIDPQAEHVASAPLMLLRAEAAIVVAEGR